MTRGRCSNQQPLLGFDYRLLIATDATACSRWGVCHVEVSAWPVSHVSNSP